MMHREEFLRKHPNIKGSMLAYGENGEKLGKVTTLFEDSFNIEKGLFFPKDYSVRYDDVVEVHDGELIVNLHAGEMPGEYAGSLPESEIKTAHGRFSSTWSDRIDELNKGGEIEIPLSEEDLEIQKTEGKKGEVHLRKFVHTEDRTITVPVRSEELVIERTMPAGGIEAAGPDEMAFSEEDLTIPLMEERVEVLKSRHIRETVHVKKESRMEDREVKDTVRIEDVQIDTPEKGSVKEGMES